MAPATDERDDVGDEPIEQASSAERRLGIVAGSYRLTRHIGSGGSSHVFEAEHIRLGKRFAVKLLRPELDPNRRTAQRFRREARAIARLQSEHIVSVIDCGELDDGTPYLVMELLEGEDLRSLLNRERSLPARRAVPLIIEACRGLSVVHAAGLVHRDLKPENLFIARRGTGEDWCKVLDFGVAKMDASLSTVQGAIVGTLRYMAPEQLEAGSTLGPATDVYALGAILYECLCGQPAHPGGTAQEVMYSVMNRAAPTAPLHAASISTTLVDAVTSCLAKKQALRPRDTTELVAMLSQTVSGGGAFPTLSEDDGIIRSQPSQLERQLPRHFLWVPRVLALAGAALVGWVGAGATPSSNGAPKSATHPRGATSQSAPTTITAEPPPTAAAVTQPSQAAAKSPLKASAPLSDASAAPHSRRHPKPVRSQPVPSAQPPNVAMGKFDTANPYPE